jgi:hypothetical protein
MEKLHLDDGMVVYHHPFSVSMKIGFRIFFYHFWKTHEKPSIYR